MNKFIRWVIGIELVLLAIMLVLLWVYKDSNDFSLLIILYPIYAMFGLAVIAIPIIIISLFTRKGNSTSSVVKPSIRTPNLTNLTKAILVTAFLGIPIVYMTGFVSERVTNIATWIEVGILLIGLGLLTVLLLRKLLRHI